MLSTGIAQRCAGMGLAALALCLGRIEPAEAQWFQGGGYIGGGVATTSTGALDDVLQASGYPRFGRGAIGVGVGAYATVARKVMFGFEWNGIIKQPRDHQGRTIHLGGGYGTLGLGYALSVSPRTRVYPRLGLGGGGLGLTFGSTEDTVGFDAVLGDPDGQADLSRGFQPSLTRGYSVLDLGFGAEFLPSRGGRGTLIGLRAGYLLAPSSSDWELNTRPVRGGPAATMAGAYIRMVVGVGAWR